MKHKSLFREFASVMICLVIGKYAFTQGPFTIGTIHPGDSIVIKYDVTINNPLVPPNAPSISNQGTVSGGNFSNVLTDDPDTGPVGDPTITLLNVFPLPVTLTELRASQAGSNIALSWKVAAEYNLEKYEIEKSADGRNFTTIGSITARNAPGTLNYVFTDLTPFVDNNYYRLRMVDIDGNFKYSMVVRVKIGGIVRVINIFPNPVTAMTLNLSFQNMYAGKYNVCMYNSIGQAVFTKQIIHTGGSATEILLLPRGISKGIYQLQVSTGQERQSFKLLVQ